MAFDKSKINEAFKTLRKQGYFARQNFQCCSSCAWSAISKKDAKKAVFFHAQDAQQLKESGETYIAWSGNGFEITGVFAQAGVKVEWNGSDSQRIKISCEEV